MKKTIGIIGVVAVAAAMFFSTNSVNNNNTNLANLIAMNVANAEDGGGCNGNFTRSVKNYKLHNKSHQGVENYDEDDCVKKWSLSATQSGYCCFYD